MDTFALICILKILLFPHSDSRKQKQHDYGGKMKTVLTAQWFSGRFFFFLKIFEMCKAFIVYLLSWYHVATAIATMSGEAPVIGSIILFIPSGHPHNCAEVTITHTRTHTFPIYPAS